MLLNARKLWRPGNHTEHILLAIEDVTERRRIAEELLRSNEDLQRFAYVLLTTGLANSGLTLLQLLVRRRKETLEEGDAQLLTLAIENFTRLGELMEDILRYSAATITPRISTRP